MPRLEVVIRRDRVTELRVVPAPEPAPLVDGEAELALDLFGLTANNITYATLGERLGYWRFFPTAEAGWGRVPVWGFGVVARSAAGGVAVGERVYGYFPMASHVVVRPRRVDATGFLDGTAHRRELHAAYNQYLRVAADPSYVAGAEAEQVVLRPLFATSFLLDDLLDEEYRDDPAVALISSASSKTAVGLAFLLARRRSREIVGLTSARNVAAVERLGLHDRVLPYDALASLPARASIYIDFSGDAALRDGIRRHLGPALRRDLAIGFTHHESLASGDGEIFFAPARFQRRAAEWTPAGLAERLGAAWRDFLAAARDRGWLTLARGRGPEAIAAAWRDVAAGSGAAHALSFA